MHTELAAVRDSHYDFARANRVIAVVRRFMRLRLKRTLKILGVVFAGYSIVYAILSLTGGYVLTQSGE